MPFDSLRFFPSILVVSMRISFHLSRRLCLACLCGIWPIFAFADRDSTPSKETAKPTASDTEKKESEKKEPEKKDSENRDSSNKPKSNAPGKGKPDAANKTGLKGAEFNAEKEKAALDFAAQHHPELVSLITPLKTSNPREYQRAVRELFRTTERLSGIRVNNPVRYELELDAWKLQSQIRLLTARLTMTTDPELELQLREALKKKGETQLRLLQNERAALQSRIDTVQKEIDRTSQSPDQLVQQEYDRLLKKTERDRNAIAPKSTSGKPAGNKKANAAKSPSAASTGK